MNSSGKYSGKHESSGKSDNSASLAFEPDRVARLRREYSDNEDRAYVFIVSSVAIVLLSLLLMCAFDFSYIPIVVAAVLALCFLIKGITLLPPNNLCRKCFEGKIETVSDNTYETGRHDTTVRRTVEDVTTMTTGGSWEHYTGVKYKTQRVVFLPGYTVNYERVIERKCSYCGEVTKDVRNYSRTYEY